MVLVVRPAVLRLELPFPPSNNVYYRHVGAKTLLSEDGRKYQTLVAGLMLAAGRPRAPSGVRLSVTLDVFPPDRRRRDLDNLPKGLLDALVTAQVIADDSLIDELTLTRRSVVRGGAVKVTIGPYEAEEGES